jgi:hypothetical protein
LFINSPTFHFPEAAIFSDPHKPQLYCLNLFHKLPYSIECHNLQDFLQVQAQNNKVQRKTECFIAFFPFCEKSYRGIKLSDEMNWNDTFHYPTLANSIASEGNCCSDKEISASDSNFVFQGWNVLTMDRNFSLKR